MNIIIGILVGIIILLVIACMISHHDMKLYQSALLNALNRNDDLLFFIKDLEEHMLELKEDKDDTVGNH